MARLWGVVGWSGGAVHELDLQWWADQNCGAVFQGHWDWPGQVRESGGALERSSSGTTVRDLWGAICGALPSLLTAGGCE